MKKYRVPSSAITERGLRKKLREAAEEYSSTGAWAQEHGITPQAVSAFIRKVQTAGIQIPEALGYRPQVVYLPLDEPLISTPAPSRKSAKQKSKKDKVNRHEEAALAKAMLRKKKKR